MLRLGMLQALTVTYLAGFGVAMANEKGPLNLSGNQYWRFPLENVGDIGIDRLTEEREGMLIDAPPRIYLDEHRTIPLVCLRTQSKEKAREVSLATTTKVILSHLETGDVQLVDLQRSPDVGDSGPLSKGWINEWHVADIKELADLGESLGKYAVWLVCGPEESNAVQFQIYPDRKSESNGDTRVKIESLRNGKTGDFPAIRATSPFITALLTPPSKTNLSPWSLAREGKDKDKPALRLEFEITGLPRFLFPKGPSIAVQNGKNVRGLIPVLLVGFTMDHRLAYRENLQVPVVNAPKGPEDEPQLTGAALIALHKDPAFDAKIVSYVWAISMNHRSLVKL